MLSVPQSAIRDPKVRVPRVRARIPSRIVPRTCLSAARECLYVCRRALGSMKDRHGHQGRDLRLPASDATRPALTGERYRERDNAKKRHAAADLGITITLRRTPSRSATCASGARGARVRRGVSHQRPHQTGRLKLDDPTGSESRRGGGTGDLGTPQVGSAIRGQPREVRPKRRFGSRRSALPHRRGRPSRGTRHYRGRPPARTGSNGAPTTSRSRDARYPRVRRRGRHVRRRRGARAQREAGNVRRFSAQRVRPLDHHVGFLLALPKGCGRPGGISTMKRRPGHHLPRPLHRRRGSLFRSYTSRSTGADRHQGLTSRSAMAPHIRDSPASSRSLGRRVARVPRSVTTGRRRPPVHVYETGSLPEWTICMRLITITGLIKRCGTDAVPRSSFLGSTWLCGMVAPCEGDRHCGTRSRAGRSSWRGHEVCLGYLRTGAFPGWRRSRAEAA